VRGAFHERYIGAVQRVIAKKVMTKWTVDDHVVPTTSSLLA
jgi:hypothetical protein